MAGHASNWFKTGGAGASAKGRVFVSNTALRRLGLTKEQARAALANGSYTVRAKLRSVATTPSGVAQPGGAISTATTTATTTPITTSASTSPSTVRLTLQEAIDRAAAGTGLTIEHKKSVLGQEYSTVAAPHYSGQINHQTSDGVMRPEDADVIVQRHVALAKQAQRMQDMAREMGYKRDLKIGTMGRSTITVTVMGSEDRGKGATKSHSYYFPQNFDIHNDNDVRRFLQMLLEQNPGYTKAPKRASVSTARQLETAAQAGGQGVERPDIDTPVSASFTIPGGRSAVAKPAENALRAVDSVHTDGVLPRIVVESASRRNAYGVYMAGRNKITILPSGSHRELTTLHEIGHMIDHLAFGTGMKFGSVSNPAFQALNRALDNSAAIRRLQELTKAPDAIAMSGRTLHGYVSINQDGTRQVPRKYINYLLKREEQFARAYAQWIAIRSKHETAMKSLRDWQRENGPDLPVQWDDADFEPIARAFDDLFRERGWLKNG